MGRGERGGAVSERKSVLLRLDPAVHDALARWAGDELRSTNAQIEFLLRRALADAGGCPGTPGRCGPAGGPARSSQREGAAAVPSLGSRRGSYGSVTRRTLPVRRLPGGAAHGVDRRITADPPS